MVRKYIPKGPQVRPVKIHRTENDVRAAAQVALGSRPDTRLWRNNVGEGWQGITTVRVNGDVTLRDARRIRYGLCEGSADLIGYRSIEVTPDMVGKRIAVFVGLEAKNPHGGRVTAQQSGWLSIVKSHGGLAGVFRTVDEAAAILDSCCITRQDGQ